jgi:L-alanine-DL-glutamate epimerase-like enolase superfamily enzyme
MKIARIETLQADGGWRLCCFVKVTTDEGLIGWSEYGEHTGTAGLSGVILKLGELLVGRDPLAIESAAALLRGRTLQASGGVNQHAIAALTNALLDIKGKALGVPVHQLLGGAVRDRIPVYWSHCGSYRIRHAALLGVPAIRGYEDWVKLGEEVRRRGFRALKTSIMPFRDGAFTNFSPSFAHTPGWPELNPDRVFLASLDRQLAALRQGAGEEVEVMLDVNFHFKTEGFVEVARAVAPHRLMWLELDTYDPAALAHIRRISPCPIASAEACLGRRELRRMLDAGALDVAIIDVVWNGYLEAMKMAALAEIYEVNVAPHNYGGPLTDLMSAHFAAAVPNLRIMEIDVDDVPWREEFVTVPPCIDSGMLIVPQAPGWGTEVNEAALRARPPK